MRKRVILTAALTAVVALGGCGVQPEAQAQNEPRMDIEQSDPGASVQGEVEKKETPTITPEMQAYLDEKPWEKIKPMISVAAESAKLIKKLGYDGITDTSAGEAMRAKDIEFYGEMEDVVKRPEDQVPPELREANEYMVGSMNAIFVSACDMKDAAYAAANRDKDTFVSKIQESQTAAEDCARFWDVFISKMKEATGMSENELAQIGISKDTMKPVTG